jgi:hypothetical protein
MPEEPTYFIKRFRFLGDATVVKAGLTLEEAQEHCNREETHGEGWFDGYASTEHDNPDWYPLEYDGNDVENGDLP